MELYMKLQRIRSEKRSVIFSINVPSQAHRVLRNIRYRIIHRIIIYNIREHNNECLDSIDKNIRINIFIRQKEN